MFSQSVEVNVFGSNTMYSFLRDYTKRGVDAYVNHLEAHAEHPLVDIEFLDLTGLPKALEIEKRYLPQERLAKYENSNAFVRPRSEEARLGGLAWSVIPQRWLRACIT